MKTLSPRHGTHRLGPAMDRLIAVGRMALLGGAMSVMAMGGCQSQGTTSSKSSGQSSVLMAASSSAAPAAVVAEVEKSHVIGPEAAREMDYRVAWQYIGDRQPYKLMSVQGDSVFVLDRSNFLTRIKIQDGNRLWRMQVAEPIEEVFGVNFTGERLYVTTGGSVLVLDPGTGSQLQRQSLLQVANTGSVMFGPYLIYGSRNGQVVWHSGELGSHWRAYQIAQTMNVAPRMSERYIAAVGNDGSVIVLDAVSTRQYWSKRLLAPVVRAPAFGDGVLYVAGLDQYLYAFDLGTGRNLWKVLTESQLTDSPAVIGDRVYQQVPQHGLYCFAALPPDNPGGEMVWKAPDVHGNVILGRRNDLFVWDAQAKQMTLVDATRGSIVKAINAPAVKHLTVAGPKHTDIYAASDDGRIVRLVPRN